MRSLSKVIKVTEYREEKARRHLLLPLHPPKRVEDQTDHLPSPAVTEEEGKRAAEQERLRMLKQAEEEVARLYREAEEKVKRLMEEEHIKLEKEREKIYQGAREEGFQAGWEEGVKKGEEEAKGRYESLISQAEELLLDAEKEAKRRIKESEEELLLLSIQIAEKILHFTLKRDEDAFLAMVKEAILQNDERHEITLRTNPSSYIYLKSRLSTLKEMISDQAKLILLPDPKIEENGVVIQTSTGNLDARLSSQLEEIKAALLQACRRGEEDE